MPTTKRTPVRVGTVLEHVATGVRCEVTGLRGRPSSRSYAVMHLPSKQAQVVEALALHEYRVVPTKQLQKEAQELAKQLYTLDQTIQVKRYVAGYAEPPVVEQVTVVAFRTFGRWSGGKPMVMFTCRDAKGVVFKTDDSQLVE